MVVSIIEVVIKQIIKTLLNMRGKKQMSNLLSTGVGPFPNTSNGNDLEPSLLPPRECVTMKLELELPIMDTDICIGVPFT